MNCERIENLLIAYMDGRAEKVERAEVEAHLATCAECRARVEEYRRLWNVLDEAPAHDLSPAFDARLRESMAADEKPSWFGWLFPQPRLAFALGLLLVAGVWIGSFQPPAEEFTQKNPAVEEEFKIIKDLPVLEDLDVLANFEVLAEVPQAQHAAPRKM